MVGEEQDRFSKGETYDFWLNNSFSETLIITPWILHLVTNGKCVSIKYVTVFCHPIKPLNLSGDIHYSVQHKIYSIGDHGAF